MGKIIETRKLYKDTIKDITKTEENWLSFLNSSAWNFKYDFEDQILIYAQRPSATACAEMSLWNDRVHRWVNKDADGIFVLSKDENSKYPFVLVFDVADTHNYRGTPYKLWSIKPEYEQEIIETLDSTFGAESTEKTISQSIILNAYNMVTDNIQDYMSSIQKYKIGTKLEDISDDEIQQILIPIVWASVSYMMMTRCGIDARKEINIQEFSYIKNFNTDKIITILGTAISDIAEQGIREIAKTVTTLQKEENRNHTFVKNQKQEYSNNKEIDEGGIENGENRIHESRQLQYAKSSDDTGENTKWQIRKNEATLPKTKQESRIYNIEDGQQVGRTSITSTRTSNGNDKSNSTEISQTREHERRIENERSNEVDRVNEQLQDDSRGTSDDRFDLQLNLLTEEEQKQNIAEAENAPVFSFSQEIIDNVLQKGSGFEDGKFRIYQQLTKGLASKENADFLKNEYGTGGFSGMDKIWVDYNAKGIILSKDILSDNNIKRTLTWTQVEKRLRELISSDRYLSDKEKDEYFDWLDLNGIKTSESQKNIKEDKDYKLAERLHIFIKDYDWYSYMDNMLMGNTEEDDIELILADINDYENIKEYIEFFKTAIEDWEPDDENAVEMRKLIYELENRLPNYEFNIGDIVYIGIDEYEIRSIDNEKVTLADIKFPIMTKEIPRDIFENRVKENSANDRLRTGNKKENQKKEILKPKIIEENKYSNEKRKKELESFIGKEVKINENIYTIVGFEQEDSIYDEEDMTNEIADSLDLFNLQDVKTKEYTIEPVGYVKILVTEEQKDEKPLIDRLHNFLNEYDIYDVDEVTLDEVRDTLNDKQRILDTIDYFYEILDSEDILDEFSTELSNFIKELTELYESKDKEQKEIIIEPKEEKIKINIKKKRRNKIEYFDLHPEISLKDRNNYSIENNELGVGTPREKFRRNIDAIKILKKCTEENRYATPEEQEILAQYVGWGGLAEVFDLRKNNWLEEYKELKELLTEKEYEEARASSLTAFYTPPIVINSIYKALEKMGLEKGNILEPSCRNWKLYGNVARRIISM